MGLYSRCSSGCVKLSTLGQVGSTECCGPLLTQVAVGECSNNSEPNSRISSTEGGEPTFAAGARSKLVFQESRTWGTLKRRPCGLRPDEAGSGPQSGPARRSSDKVNVFRRGPGREGGVLRATRVGKPVRAVRGRRSQVRQIPADAQGD